MTTITLESIQDLADCIDYGPRDERLAAALLVALVLAEGGTLSVNDGEEWTVRRSDDAETVLRALGTTESDTLKWRDADGRTVGVFWLVWGNSGDELIADHTANDECRHLWGRWYAIVSPACVACLASSPMAWAAAFASVGARQ